MAYPEHPKPHHIEGVSMPKEVAAEAAGAKFAEVTEKLWELGVVPVPLNAPPIVYSRPLDMGRWLTMLAVGEEVDDDEQNRRLGQRLIFNTRYEDEETGRPRVRVDDYLVDYADDSILHLPTEIGTKETREGPMYDFNSNMAPFINRRDAAVDVTSGSKYEELMNVLFAAEGKTSVEAGESLMQKLSLFHVAHRDDDIHRLNSYHR